MERLATHIDVIPEPPWPSGPSLSTQAEASAYETSCEKVWGAKVIARARAGWVANLGPAAGYGRGVWRAGLRETNEKPVGEKDVKATPHVTFVSQGSASGDV